MNLTNIQRNRSFMCSVIFCSFMLFVSFYYKFNKKTSNAGNGNLNHDIYQSPKRVKRSKWKNILKFSRVCATKKCRQLGNQFKKIINGSVDPCDDFYEFVCGKYSRNEEMTSDLTTISTADQNILDVLKKDLSQPINESDPKSVKYAINMYKGCIDTKTLESRGVRPVIQSLNTIGGWPLIGQISPFNEQQYNRFDGLAKLISLFALDGIIEVIVEPDLIDNTKSVLSLYPAPNLFSRSNIFENMMLRSRDRSPPRSPSSSPKLKIKPIFERSKSPTKQISVLYDFIMQIVLIMGGNNDQDTLQQIDDMIDFSSKLISIQQKIEQSDSNDNSINYNRFTFKQLNELTSNKIDWLKFANKIYSLTNSKYRFNQDDIFMISEPEYFKQLPNILSETSNKVIANFLGFKLVQWYGLHTVQALKGLFDQEDISYVCLDLLKNNMGLALSRKYVEQHSSSKTRSNVKELVDYIQDAFIESLGKNTILDKTSKNRSLAKLRAINKNVDYPDWLFDDRTLDEQYDLRKKCYPKLLFDCIVYLMRREVFLTFDSIDKAINLTIMSWIQDLTEVNAYYVVTQNSITIPAAIINIFFMDDNPRQVNYATLGDIVGHELTHEFGPVGSMFDEKGNLDPIWDTTTQTRFGEQEQCFVDQYNNYCELDFCIDGENTLDENIADNGGILWSYKAYQVHSQNKGQCERLPYVSQYTPDQLFFISYATVWCDNTSLENLGSEFMDDNHSPSKYRVNGVLADIVSFAKAYNCPINSTMNPIKKCDLW